jgi:hypothetical protein
MYVPPPSLGCYCVLVAGFSGVAFCIDSTLLDPRKGRRRTTPSPPRNLHSSGTGEVPPSQPATSSCATSSWATLHNFSLSSLPGSNSAASSKSCTTWESTRPWSEQPGPTFQRGSAELAGGQEFQKAEQQLPHTQGLVITLGFLIPRFWADRKSSMFGVPAAAPGPQNPFQQVGREAAHRLGGVWGPARPPGPQNQRFPAGPKTMYFNPSVVSRGGSPPSPPLPPSPWSQTVSNDTQSKSEPLGRGARG